MKLVHGRIPPGGFHFEVAPGVKLTAINMEKLVEQVFAYRLRQNIPIGDIERDVSDYYCRQWPSACHKEPADYGHGGGHLPSAEPLINRVSRFASTLLARQPRGGFTLVPAAEAESRARICATCPHNQPWRVGCRGCSSTTATLLAQIRHSASTPVDNHLFGCQVAGWENLSAVHYPHGVLELTESQVGSLPDRCWRKNAA